MFDLQEFSPQHLTLGLVIVNDQVLRPLVDQSSCLSCLSLFLPFLPLPSSLLHSFLCEQPVSPPWGRSRFQCCLEESAPPSTCPSLPAWVLLPPARPLASSGFGPECQGLKFGLFFRCRLLTGIAGGASCVYVCHPGTSTAASGLSPS